MRHFKGVSLATLTPIVLASMTLFTAALTVRETSRSFPILSQTNSTINLALPFQSQPGEQLYARCPPVNCGEGGSR